ncbi:MAG TPA: hypothetical protein VKF63_00770 [Terracidiphilus sp.]|nr:hypothetical protein [Terracidiphilus sp.]
MTYKTCNHLHDNGHTCNSAAAKGRNYCVFHLRYRARLLRMAQVRARGERFDLKLPPLESMYAVQSALSHLAEALAADMIDPKRAQALLSVLRLASLNLRHPEKWQTALYHADQPGPAIDLAAEFGLPDNLDLDTPPEVAFPPPQTQVPEGAPPLSPDFGDRVGFGRATPPSATGDPLFPEVPPLRPRDYAAEAETAMNEVTPQDLELNDILKTQGYKAMERRAREHQRNADRRRQRNLFRANYEHYAAAAKVKNIQRAAEKLLAERLAAENAAAATTQPEPSDTRKPPARAVSESAQATQQEAKSIA